MTHGTPGGYFKWFCRCDACREAAVAYMREYRRRRGCAVSGCDRPYSRSVEGVGYCSAHTRSAREQAA